MGRRPVRREPLADINERLFRLKEVRVIGSDGGQLGVLDTRDAVKQAQDQHLKDMVASGDTAHGPAFDEMKRRWRRPGPPSRGWFRRRRL